jgi:hypothetical protein
VTTAIPCNTKAKLVNYTCAILISCLPNPTFFGIMTLPANIPVIDLSGPDQASVAKELVEAAVSCGFVYIKNEGKDISVPDVDGAFDMVSLA